MFWVSVTECDLGGNVSTFQNRSELDESPTLQPRTTYPSLPTAQHKINTQNTIIESLKSCGVFSCLTCCQLGKRKPRNYTKKLLSLNCFHVYNLSDVSVTSFKSPPNPTDTMTKPTTNIPVLVNWNHPSSLREQPEDESRQLWSPHRELHGLPVFLLIGLFTSNSVCCHSRTNCTVVSERRIQAVFFFFFFAPCDVLLGRLFQTRPDFSAALENLAALCGRFFFFFL